MAKFESEPVSADTAAAEAEDEVVNTEARKIINASTNSIENAIKKINASPPTKEYLVSIHEKMTELLNIMKEIKI